MKKHLLLIDDDIDEFDFIARIIEEMPMLKFSYASNGKNGLEQMANDMPDIVLLDMNMPAMNGLECLQKIKKTETLKSIPVYMYSNSHTVSFVNEARQLGATDCLKKPGSIEILREMITRVLTT